MASGIKYSLITFFDTKLCSSQVRVKTISNISYMGTSIMKPVCNF